ncbi:MAG: hypothetical protein JST86_13605 [Bacteroidetes bacterium]|nr:hypothetical protein [Bacteroidota bacterium]
MFYAILMTLRCLLVTLIFGASINWVSSCNTRPKLRLSIPGLDSTTHAIKVDINDLINNYKSYHGQIIETTGRFYQGFEEFAIYGRKPFFKQRKGFWLEEDLNLKDDSAFFEKINGQMITIKGVVDTTQKGHLGMYVAEIRRIYFFEKY